MDVLIVAGVLAVVTLMTLAVWLLDFARASRTDALDRPASSAQARRARRLTGMYVRGGVGDTDDTGELVRR
ncbi:hypothetical protein [Actinomadura atramentaria]|uniref:hypothetical protein n=1 Tax=Actinomadura atramentaria TaxID=1990 RepID=UPI0003728E70|nr:hypothetical protein [Actinomadura atramentaria]